MLGEESKQCLYTSGSAASENILEICQIFYQPEGGIARRGFWSVAARHQLFEAGFEAFPWAICNKLGCPELIEFYQPNLATTWLWDMQKP